MKIYAVSGHAQHGKDTVASMMQKKLSNDGHRVLVAHYADLLKYICMTFFGWDGNKDEKGRHILQYVGTDVVRKENPDFWVDFIISILNLFGDAWDYVIIPDTRFPNEIEKLRREGFDVKHIQVVRPGFVGTLTDAQKAHPSETALDNVKPDYCLVNCGDLTSLESLVNQYIKENIYG